MADVSSQDPLGRSDGGPASGRSGSSASGGSDAADQARQPCAERPNGHPRLGTVPRSMAHATSDRAAERLATWTAEP